MTYQRGFDLLNCPDDCPHSDKQLSWDTHPVDAYGMHVESYKCYCIARSTDTCPREEAEKQKERTNG